MRALTRLAPVYYKLRPLPWRRPILQSPCDLSKHGFHLILHVHRIELALQSSCSLWCSCCRWITFAEDSRDCRLHLQYCSWCSEQFRSGPVLLRSDSYFRVWWGFWESHRLLHPVPWHGTGRRDWSTSGVSLYTGSGAYPLLLGGYALVPLRLFTTAYVFFHQVTESIIWYSRVQDRAFFDELFSCLFDASSSLPMLAEAVLSVIEPIHACSLPCLVTRFYTLSCIVLIL